MEKFEKWHIINCLLVNVPCMSLEVARFIACQSSLETAEFKSAIYRENMNLFGMKMPKKRVTTAVKESRGHAAYASYFSSVFDYLLWLQMSGFTQNDLKDLGKFIARLEKSHYCPSYSYVQTIVSLYNKFYNNENDKTREE